MTNFRIPIRYGQWIAVQTFQKRADFQLATGNYDRRVVALYVPNDARNHNRGHFAWIYMLDTSIGIWAHELVHFCGDWIRTHYKPRMTSEQEEALAKIAGGMTGAYLKQRRRIEANV